MAVCVALIVWGLLALVDREFKLEIGFGVLQKNERKIVEIEAARDVQAQGAFIKIHRLVFIEHADHGVNGFGHGNLSFFTVIHQLGGQLDQPGRHWASTKRPA
jgi:hypothetical protein